MCVDESFVMPGGSLVSIAVWGTCTALSMGPGLASALKPVQTRTTGVTLLMTVRLSLCKRRNSQDPLLAMPQCPGPLHLLHAAVTLTVTPHATVLCHLAPSPAWASVGTAQLQP